MEELYIGKMLDNRYEILEQVGIGGMSMVYKAKCHRLNRLVALKVLKPELAKDEDFRRRFHDESQAIAMLSHPNIVSVYDVSKSSELEYIVMELIDGISLKQYMHRKGGALSWKESLHFMTQIVKALGHAHSRGIIHRDIKPQNIMVLRDGSVKVADFGIARLLSAQQATLTQEALGSVHYISPEQAKGSRIDCRSDLYSAGVVLYEMLTGQLPFEGDTPVSVAIQHINSIPLSPRERNPEIPEALEAITMKAMAPNMKSRYMDADEMLADLEEFRKNPNISFDYVAAQEEQEEEGDEPTRPIPLAATRKAFTTGSIRRGERTEESDEEDGDDEDDYYDDREKKRGISPIILGIAALLIFFVGVGYFLWVSFFSGLLEPTEYYTIPNLVGKTVTEIQMDPAVVGTFTVEQSAVIYSETVPAGQVIKQTPNAGEKRKAGDLVITIEISAGQEEVEMIDVVGKEYREGYLAISELGLNMATPEYVFDEKVTKGYIIAQDPVEGTVMSPGQTVNVIVSKGPEVAPVTMISFEGATIDQAKKQIVEMKLVVGEITYEPDMSLPGTVLGQSVAVGTEVPEGSFVDLIVSKGPAEDEPVETGDPNETTPPTTTPTPGDDTPVSGVVTPNPVPATKYKNVTVNLGSGSGTVQVTIKVSGKIAYDNTVERSLGTLNVTVPGAGVQEVSVYLNGTLTGSTIIDFTT